MDPDKMAPRPDDRIVPAQRAVSNEKSAETVDAQHIAWMAGAYFRMITAQGVPHDRAHDHVLRCLAERHGLDREVECGDAGCLLRKLDEGAVLPYCDRQDCPAKPMPVDWLEKTSLTFRLVAAAFIYFLLSLLTNMVVTGLRI